MRIIKENIFDEIASAPIPDAEVNIVVDTEPKGPESAEEIATSSLLLNAISDCAKTIEQYNIIKVNLTDPDMVAVIDEIANEENIILGKLQSLLKTTSPNAENIMNGAVEVEQGLTENLNEGQIEIVDNYKLQKGDELTLWWKNPKGETEYALVEYNGRDKDKNYKFTSVTYGWEYLVSKDLAKIKAPNKNVWYDRISHGDNDSFPESLTEGRRRGFLKQYKGYSIHDCGNTFVITNKNGTTVHQSPTVAGCEGWIDNEVDNKVSESIDTDLMNAVQDAYGYNKKEAKDYIKTIDDKTKAELIKNFKDNAKRSFLTDSLNEDTTKKRIDLLYSKNGFKGRNPSFGYKFSSIDNVYNELLYYIEEDGRSTVERTFRVNVTPCKPEDIYKNSMSVSDFLRYYENTYGKQNESLKESKDELETKVFDFLDNESSASDYNQMVEDVSVEFHISRKKAEQYVWDYLSAEEIDEYDRWEVPQSRDDWDVDEPYIESITKRTAINGVKK